MPFASYIEPLFAIIIRRATLPGTARSGLWSPLDANKTNHPKASCDLVKAGIDGTLARAVEWRPLPRPFRR